MAMPDDDAEPVADSATQSQNVSKSHQQAPAGTRSLFTIPTPLKRIFDKFPLVTYAENGLPLRTPTDREANILHVFTTVDNARLERPSFNPACLKWQTYLKLSGVPFKVVPSSNHASPSGALPFLLPAASNVETEKMSDPIPSNKLRKWLATQSTAAKMQAPGDVRYEAYTSLVDSRIRKAWLYQLYIAPTNSPLVHRLYVEPCSSHPFVQMTIAYQLRRAAETEVVKASASNKIVEEEIMSEAEEAFVALSTLLGREEWFFGQQKPGLFDASVFAYTHLILDDHMDWQDNKLAKQMMEHNNLVQHQERILEIYF